MRTMNGESPKKDRMEIGMNLKFRIDSKKLETRKWVNIGKEIYARKILGSIEIYEIPPIKFTPEDRKRILKVRDKLDHREPGPILRPPLESYMRICSEFMEKYCDHCPNEEICMKYPECELSDVIYHSKRRGRYSGAIWELGENGLGVWKKKEGV